MEAFGGPVRLVADDAEDLLSSASAAADMDRVYEALTALNGGGPGSLRIYRPHPTAAFAPRDTTLPAYGVAAEAMRALGFEPVERRAGGQLAVYDSRALVVDLIAPHEDPRQQTIERFKAFSAAIVQALSQFGIDARVGQVAGEYCPGDYSVNARGQVKLAGVAQRIGRRGYHMGAVISVTSSDAVVDAVAEAYRILGFPFDPATFGSVGCFAPDAGPGRLRDALMETLGRLVRISPCG